MEIVEGIDSYRSSVPACVTIGTFDGVHIGHRKLLATLVAIARRECLRSVVITFDPHPRQVLSPGAEVRFVLTREEKVEMFASLGVDVLVIHPFSKEFAAISAKDFLVRVLHEKMKMSHLVKGFNNHFGCDRLSDVGYIRALGGQYGFAVTQVGAECCDGVSASSTLVRRLIAEGNMEETSKILGYKFFVEGTVVHGRMLGRTIGFPTANIDVGDHSKILPRTGAYVAYVAVLGNDYPAILNIGSNPTVNGDNNKVFLEVHIIGFNADIYGAKLRAYILHRIRNEVTFGSIDELRVQLARDKEVALSVITQCAS